MRSNTISRVLSVLFFIFFCATAGASTFKKADEVITTAYAGNSLRIRECASTSCAIVQNVQSNYTGFVTNGPVYAEGYYWYRINWDKKDGNVVAGWSVSNDGYGDTLRYRYTSDNAPFGQFGSSYYSVFDGGSTYLSGQLSDDVGIYLIQMYVWKEGATSKTWVFNEYMYGASSKNIGDYYFSTGGSYYQGPGVYNIELKTYDTIYQSTSITTKVNVTARDNPPTVNLSSQNYSVENGSRIYFSGNIQDDWGLSNLWIYVRTPSGKTYTAFQSSITGGSVSLSNYSFDTNQYYNEGPGSYMITIAAGDTLNQQGVGYAYVTVVNPVVVDAPPIFDDTYPAYTVQHGSAISYHGTISDDNLISTLTVTVIDPDGVSTTAYSENIRQKSVDLSKYFFSTTAPYYVKPGSYRVVFKVNDFKPQTSTFTAYVNVDASDAIKQLRDEYNAIESKLGNYALLLYEKKAKEGLLTEQGATNIETIYRLEDLLNGTPRISYSGVSTPELMASKPNGCVADPSGFPSEFPLSADLSYTEAYKCYQNGRGAVYLLSGIKTHAYTSLCQKKPAPEDIYPALVVLFDNSGKLQQAIVVDNLHRAGFFVIRHIAYLEEKQSIFNELTASRRLEPVEIAPSEEEQSFLREKYEQFRAETNEVIEDGIIDIFGIYPDDPASEPIFTGLKSILEAGIGSIPFVQQITGLVELCTGEEILTDERVELDASRAATFIVPGGKLLKKYRALSDIPGVLRALPDESSAIAAGKKMLGPVRKTANVLGKWGEDAVRARYPNLPPKANECVKMYIKLCRLPDIYDEATGEIGEVKNVTYQALTSQIKDYIGYAKRNSPSKKLDLYIRDYDGMAEDIRDERKPKNLSGPLWEAVLRGDVNVIPVNMPH